jgi:prolyl 4-hydroxylase
MHRIILYLMVVLFLVLIVDTVRSGQSHESWVSVMARPVFEYKLGDAKESNPEPRLIRGFISDQEIEAILRDSDAKGFHASLIEDNKEQLKIRKSETCWLYPSNNETIRRIYERARALPELTDEDEDDLSFEPCQIVRYTPGGHYSTHYDQCHDKSIYCTKQIEEYKGPRKWTLLMYITDDFEGGETWFPMIQKSFRGKKGDALLFHTLTPDNLRVHPHSLHQGSPVKSGEKRIANIWIRTKTVVA